VDFGVILQDAEPLIIVVGNCAQNLAKFGLALLKKSMLQYWCVGLIHHILGIAPVKLVVN